MKTGKIIITTGRFDSDSNYKVLKRLNYVPNEYKEIESFDWFNNTMFEK